MRGLQQPLLGAGVTGAKAGPPTEGSSLAQSTFNLTKNILGIGLLSLPSAVAAGTGIIPALCLTLLLGVYSGYTFSVFARVCSSTGTKNMKGLGLATRGPLFATVMDWVCTVRTSFSCLAFSIVVADSFTSILRSSGVVVSRDAVLGMVSVFVLFPLCSLRDLSGLAYTSLLGVVGIGYTTIFMVIRLLDGSYAPGGEFFGSCLTAQPVTASLANPWSVNVSTLVLVCSLSTAISAHYNAPKYWDQLRNRSVKRFNRVTSVSFGLVTVICSVAMVAGLLTFGSHAQGNILNNYSSLDPLATAARLGVASSVVCTYPLAFTGLRDGVLSLLSVDPTRRNHLTATAILLSAVTLLALAIKNVAFVVNLGGAIFGALIVYIFPSALFLFGMPRASGAERRLAKATVVFGVLLAVLGSIVAVLKEFAPTRLR